MEIPVELYDPDVILKYLEEIPDLEVIRDGDLLMVEGTEMEKILKVHLEKLRNPPPPPPPPPIVQQYFSYFWNGPNPGRLLKAFIYMVALLNLNKCSSQPLLPMFIIGMLTIWWIMHNWKLPHMANFMKTSTFALFVLSICAATTPGAPSSSQCSALLVVPSLLFSFSIYTLFAIDRWLKQRL